MQRGRRGADLIGAGGFSDVVGGGVSCLSTVAVGSDEVLVCSLIVAEAVPPRIGDRRWRVEFCCRYGTDDKGVAPSR